MNQKEEQLYAIVSEQDKSDYSFFVRQGEDDFLLYQLSDIRGNIIRGIDIPDGARLLELGAEYGAVTGALLETGCIVDSLVYTDAQEEILSCRVLRDYADYKDNHNILKELKQEQKYDYVIISDVQVESYDRLKELLELIKAHLAAHGQIILAFDNKYGLKNFAGVPDRFTGEMYSAIEGYVNHFGYKMLSLEEMVAACNETGLKIREKYYPYPDHRLAYSIYSDDYLPKVGELNRNLQNFWQDRLLCFDESRAFDTVVRDGMFQIFTNSFLLVIEAE